MRAPSPQAPLPRPLAGLAWRHEGALPRRRTVVRLWLPITWLFWLLSPIPLVLAPLGYLIPPRYRPDPFFFVFSVGELLVSLSGTVVDVDTADALVRIRID